MDKKKVNIPQKGAGRKFAKKLEELAKQKPPKDLIDKINKDDNKKSRGETSAFFLIFFLG